MGKYMRKSKTTGEVSPLGVLTRAKALALQRLQKLNNTTMVSPATGSGGDGVSYLELRSRRLVRPFMALEGRGQKNGVSKNPNLVNPNPSKIANVSGASSGVKQRSCGNSEKGKDAKEMENQKENEKSCCDVEASFGENLLEFEGSKRTTRESTPCSSIRDLETPGSSTRRIEGRVPNSRRRRIPTAQEIDEFFASSEEQQQKKFMEKYNFDPVNEKPLPGRYEWVKVDC